MKVFVATSSMLGLVASATLMGATTGAGAASPSPSAATSTITVISYNIRKNTDDLVAPKDWDTRKDNVLAKLQKLRGPQAELPDVIAVQEAFITNDTNPPTNPQGYLNNQFENVAQTHTRITANDALASENLIFYKSPAFTEVDSGVHPLPGTHPDEDATCKSRANSRTATWAELEETATGQDYFVVTTDLVAGGADCDKSRVRQARDLHNVIQTNRPVDVPVILLGDLNSNSNSVEPRPSDTTLDEVGAQQPDYRLRAVPMLSDTTPTFNKNWDGDSSNDKARLDYIFRTDEADVELSVVFHETDPSKSDLNDDGTTDFSPSDHYPVVAVLQVA